MLNRMPAGPTAIIVNALGGRPASLCRTAHRRNPWLGAIAIDEARKAAIFCHQFLTVPGGGTPCGAALALGADPAAACGDIDAVIAVGIGRSQMIVVSTVTLLASKTASVILGSDCCGIAPAMLRKFNFWRATKDVRCAAG